MAANVSLDADDVAFDADPVYNEPTVQIEGSLDLGGDWVLRRYKNGATEQVLFLERKHVEQSAVPEASDGEEDEPEEKEPTFVRAQNGSSYGYFNGPEKVVNRKENFERLNPSKPGTRSNSSAGIGDSQLYRRAAAPPLPRIVESPEQEASAPPQDDEAASCPKRKPSTDLQGAQAKQKKLKAVRADRSTKEKKKQVKNTRSEEDQKQEQEQTTIPNVAEVPVGTAENVVIEKQLDTVDEDADDVPDQPTNTTSKKKVRKAVTKKKPKKLPRDDEVLEEENDDDEIPKLAVSAKQKPAAKPNKTGGRMSKKHEVEEQNESSPEDDRQDITVPVKSKEVVGDIIVITKAPKKEKN